MTFDEALTQVTDLLQREGRVSYRALKRRFALDDEYIEDLKAELIDAKHLAVDEEGKVLVWTGEEPRARSEEPRAKDEEAGGEKSQLSSVAPGSLLPASRAEGERRQLTVMFCDLVGSTALSTQLDPEDLREVEREYQRLCGTVINHFGGHLAKYLGDGLLVYFGYPVAHEDDAARAVRAGLEIVRTLQYSAPIRYEMPFPLVGEPVLSVVEGGQGEGATGTERRLQVRIGIHTGLVVAGEMGTEDQPEHLAIVGETPNLAARIQGQANPDEVVISVATYRLVEGLFDCEDRGQPELKGVSIPLTLYRVVKEEEARSRFEVVVRKGLTPLIGRDDEVAVLRERWARAKQGDGQVILLSGEPGIGKSRLAQVLKEHVVQDGATEIEFRCSPYYQNSALYPIIEHLQRLLQFTREDSPAAKLAKLQHTLSHYRFPQTDTVPLLATLLSLPHPEGSPPLTLSPQKQKQRTQEALVTWLIEETERNAVASIWEDLHWADPSTLELLQLYLDQVPTTRMLVLLTFRPEFHPPWLLRSHMNQITLGRLGRTQVEEMVARVTSDKALPTEIVQQIVTKTDGIPLFVEELTKTVVEAVGAHGRAPLQSLAIPATLQDSLMARLDRLGDAKAVTQLGTTLGREFSYELLQAVSPLAEEPLQRGLQQLVAAELMQQRGLPPQARYVFKHALIQDTAYQSLLKSTRQQYHSQIAQVLEEKFLETKESQPELLAHHYTEAGLVAQAIPYWHKAGQKATQRSANVEAISHLTKGLELFKTLPDTPERAQQELTLQIALGIPLVATKGFAAPEVEKAYARARELCQGVGETPQLFPVLFGLWVFHFVRGELQTARELAEQALTLARRVQDPALLLEAYYRLGYTLFHFGELVAARSHLEQSIVLYDSQQHQSHALLYGQDPGVVSLSYAALALWLLGYPDQALKRNHEALALAQEVSHPFSLAFALDVASIFHQYRREEQVAQERAEAVIRCSTEQGFLLWLAFGTMLRGWALAEQERGEEGIAQLRQGLSAFRATGAEAGRAHHLTLLAEAYGKVGQAEEGLSVLAEALEAVAKSGERFYEVELYRLYGELSLRMGERETGRTGKEEKIAHSPIHPFAHSSPEECFLKAIEIARKQQAKSLELRATMSLARLWQQQGKQKEAHQMLSEIYNWFTEGFDTKDLQEAKMLLEELAKD